MTIDRPIVPDYAFKKPWSFFDGTFHTTDKVGYAIKGLDAGLDMAQTYMVYFEGNDDGPMAMTDREGIYRPYQQELPLDDGFDTDHGPLVD